MQTKQEKQYIAAAAEAIEHYSEDELERFAAKAGERTQRWALTHVGEDGLRKLTFANQGRNHFDTQQAAETRLRAVLHNNEPGRLVQIYGRDFLSSVRVDQIECYGHGDAVGIYI